ncbi:MAG: hypothetical protein ABIA78_03085 [archaeon]
MKKIGVMLVCLILFLPVLLASSVDDEIQKITHYAEEYETGNIDYIKLMLYMSSAREGLNEVLGAKSKQFGGVVKQDKLTEVLGEANEKTKWVWVEGEEHDEKLDEAVPIWKKIVFDGKKIQIRMQAFPSIFMKTNFDGFEDGGFMDEMPEEGSIIYRLNFETEFKKPEEQINIKGKISEIETLAKSGTSMETLAKESVNAEMIFNNYFRQDSGKCEDIMKVIFGSENQRQIQQILLNEIEFFSGENFEAILRLEMCDDCEWNYINFDMRLDGRGNFKPPKQGSMGDSRKQYESFSDEQFKLKTQEMLESMKTDLASGNYAGAMSYSNSLRMLTEAWNEKANNVWEQVEIKRPGKIVKKSDNQEGSQGNVVVENNQNNVVVENTEGESDNNVVDNDVDSGPQGIVGDSGGEDIVENTITGNFITGKVVDGNNNPQSLENNDPYYWIKQDQLQRQKANELKKQNYENRKSFYLGLFSGYAKEEFYFSQINFEKRLIEEFKEKGEEICNNNIDDNENEQVDCDDSQCGGKVCGKGTGVIINGNESIIEDVDFYCIAGTCQAKEQKIILKKGFCGDGFCDAINNETIETCFKDCDFLGCPVHNAIECSGKVKFSGEDEKGCQLPPICIGEEKFCEVDEDCTQLKCGVVGCVKENENEQGICKIIDLIKCGAGECEDGEKQITKCNNNEEIVTGLCVDGTWEYPDVFCPDTLEGNCNQICGDKMSVMMPECPGDLKISGAYPDCNCDWKCDEIVNDECVMASDCGGENDVCSNGKCETIPGKIYVEPEELGELRTVSPTPAPGEPEPEEPIEEPLEEPVIEPEPEAESQEEQPSEPESSNEEVPITGEIIFGFFRVLASKIGITGAVVDEGDSVDDSENDGSSDASSSDDDDVDIDNDIGTDGGGDDSLDDVVNDGGDDYGKGVGDVYDNQPNQPDGDRNQGNEEREEKDNQQREKNKQENKERCGIECARPCVDKCIRETCGEQMDCDIDKESKSCEGSCSADSNCVEKCMSGDENWWQEFQNEDMNKQEKGVFNVGGGCRTEQGRTNGYIWFGGWGDPYSQLEPLKQKYYEFGNEDWCKYEIDNMIKQRKEIEKGFDQEFAVWFFEKYLPNSAEEWEQAVSGIFELYWNNVENQMRLANNMKCLEKNDITEIMDINLINIKYETEYGKLEYWEELKIVKVPGMDESVNIISPYMKVWIFPSKEFIKYEMQESMKNHELPGSPEEKMERKNQEGLTEEQKIMVREDKGEMQMIREISEKYGGSLDLVIQFKDYETNEVVFNLFAQINEKDIMKIEPMLPSEVGEIDATVEMDFALLYEMILVSEKDMMGNNIESPPWDKKLRPVQKIKQMGNGIKIWNKMRVLKNSAIITPAEDEKTIEKITGLIMENVMSGGGQDGDKREGDRAEEKEGEDGGKKPEFEDKGISGKVVWVSE